MAIANLLSNSVPDVEVSVWYVLIASSVTAICTGLGVVPFFFVKTIGKNFLGIGNSIAAGLMLGASVGLVWEAGSINLARTAVGLVMGAVLIIATNFFLPDQEDGDEHQLLGLSKANFRKVFLIMCVMTAHSFAEGIGVGVSFGGREEFGQLISSAIAIHNIPEGIAISLVLIPRGFTKFQASLWSIFSSLPQPIMAVPLLSSYFFLSRSFH